MARLGAIIPTAALAALLAVAPARAQTAAGQQQGQNADPNAPDLTTSKKKKQSGADEELRRLDPSTLAGGDYGGPDNAALAGGDYGVPPLNPEDEQATPRIPPITSGPLDAPPSGRRKLKPLPPVVGNPRDDAYEPVGIRAGAFVLKPSIESSIGYDDNPNRIKNGQGSSFYRLRGGLDARSDWSRHELDLRVDGQIRRYLQHDITGYEPNGTAVLDGRIDVSRDTKINAELRSAITSSKRGDPDTPTNLKGDEIQKSLGATLGVQQSFNRFTLKLDGLVDRYLFDDSELVDGTKVSNKDRVYNSYALKLRGTYELSPRLAPFAEVAVDTRDYDETRQAGTGQKLGSDGYALRTGARFELSGLVSGEAAIGYGKQTPKDGSLKAVDGLLVDGALEWRPTGLTTVRLNARTDFAETTLTGSGGVLDRAVGLQVEHRLRRNLIVTARADLERLTYKGIGRVDDSTTFSLDADYRLTRELSLFAELQREKLKSNFAGQSYVANIIEFGLRLRR